MKNYTQEELETMSVSKKLAEARVRFLEGGVKKSGVNQHAEFMYFELEDIVPAATKIFDDLGLLYLISFADNIARGTLINLGRDEALTVEFPMRAIAEPGKYRMNEVQGLGAEITYFRRYLYLLILDIVEADKIDAGEAPAEKPAAEKKPRKKPATKEEREEIKENLVGADEPANEMQIEGLRLALAKLLNTDPEQEDFIQSVMVKTNGLTEITKTQAENLIGGITEMLEQYTTEENNG